MCEFGKNNINGLEVTIKLSFWPNIQGRRYLSSKPNKGKSDTWKSTNRKLSYFWMVQFFSKFIYRAVNEISRITVKIWQMGLKMFTYVKVHCSLQPLHKSCKQPERRHISTKTTSSLRLIRPLRLVQQQLALSGRFFPFL